MAIGLLAPVLSAAEDAAPAWSQCVATLRMPEYPPLGRQASIQGFVAVTVLTQFETPIYTAIDTRHRLLQSAVLDALKQSEFKPRCSKVPFVLRFEFQIEGKATVRPSTGVVHYISPNTFRIIVPPAMVMPD